jgi:hypothetical protein
MGVTGRLLTTSEQSERVTGDGSFDSQAEDYGLCRGKECFPYGTCSVC